MSPDLQREQITGWAKLRSVEIAAWHEDLDQTGGKLSRPALDRMMERIRSGATGGVAVARLDRLSRAGVADALGLVKELEAHGGQLAVVDLGIDPTTPIGKFARTLMLALAEMERDRISEAWDAAKARAIGRGVHISNVAPFGYRRAGDGRLEVDPQTAPLVAEAFRMRAAGVSWPKLAAFLNERTGGRWIAKTTRDVIRRRTYLGEARHGKHVNGDAHEPIVTLAEFDAANAITGGPGRIGQSGALLLGGVLRCAGCRYAMKLDSGRKRDGSRFYRYRCPRGAECPEPASIAAKTIERWIDGYVLTWAGDATAVEQSDKSELVAADGALRDAEARLDVWVTDLKLDVRSEGFRRGVRAREDALDVARAEYDRAKAEASDAERIATTLREDWPSMPLDGIHLKQGRVPVEQRVVVFWKGEGPTDEKGRPDVPRRGASWTPKPLPWPDDPVLASVPRWAWRVGHPAIPTELLETMRDVAREKGWQHFLPDGG